MKQPIKTYFNWSTGKDSALALYYLLQDKNYSVEALLSSINTTHKRVSMHGIRKELLTAQTKSIGIKAKLIELPEEVDMATYERIMADQVNLLVRLGFKLAAFGDIFLEDLRQYRERQLKVLNIDCIFPLWKRDTHELIHEFIDLGFKAIVVSVQANKLGAEFVGRELDAQFIANLPAGVDPCGENGEFHSFCYDGPIFKKPIPFERGEKVYKEYKKPNSKASEKQNMGFWYQDLLPIED